MAIQFGTADSNMLYVGGGTSQFNMSAGTTLQVFTGWVQHAGSLTNTFDNLLFEVHNGTDGWGAHLKNNGSDQILVYTGGANSGLIGTLPAAGVNFHVLIAYDQANTRLAAWLDGSNIYDNTSYTNTSASTNPSVSLGGRYNGTPQFNFASGIMSECAFFNAIPDAAQIAALAAGITPHLVMGLDQIIEYWPLIRDTNLQGIKGSGLTKNGTVNSAVHPRIFYPSYNKNSFISSGGITGTLAKTLDNTTSSITAILSSIGSLSETLDNTTSSASGTVGSGITGSLAETLAATTSSIAGGIYGTGSLSKTLDSITSNIAGSLSSIGSISQTLEDATSAAAGGIYGTGSLSRTLDYTTLSASGFNQHIEATLTKTLEDVTLAAYGEIPVTDTKIWFNKMGGRILGVNDITDTPYTVDDD